MYQLLVFAAVLPAVNSAPTVIATGSDVQLRSQIAGILLQRRAEHAENIRRNPKAKDLRPPLRLAPLHYQFANGSRLQMALAPATEAAAAVPVTAVA